MEEINKDNIVYFTTIISSETKTDVDISNTEEITDKGDKNGFKYF